jgi:hypothetical protein
MGPAGSNSSGEAEGRLQGGFGFDHGRQSDSARRAYFILSCRLTRVDAAIHSPRQPPMLRRHITFCLSFVKVKNEVSQKAMPPQFNFASEGSGA